MAHATFVNADLWLPTAVRQIVKPDIEKAFSNTVIVDILSSAANGDESLSQVTDDNSHGNRLHR